MASRGPTQGEQLVGMRKDIDHLVQAVNEWRNADKRGDDIPAMLARWRWLALVVFVLGRV